MVCPPRKRGPRAVAGLGTAVPVRCHATAVAGIRHRVDNPRLRVDDLEQPFSGGDGTPEDLEGLAIHLIRQEARAAARAGS